MDIDPVLKEWIDEQIKVGHFDSPQAAIDYINAKLDAGIADFDAGRVTDWDPEEIKRRGREELARRKVARGNSDSA